MRKVSVFLLVFLIVSLFAFRVEAAETLIDSYSEANQDANRTMKTTHPSASAVDCCHAQSFSCGDTYNITSAKFYLKAAGSPTGNAHAVLYALSGSIGGDDDIPTGSPLATSNPFDVSTLSSADFILETFTFNTSQQYQMASGAYAIAYQNPKSGNIDNQDYVRIGTDNSAPTHTGNIAAHDSAGWTAIAQDACFYVYGESVTAGVEVEEEISESIAIEDTTVILRQRTTTYSDTISITDIEVTVRARQVTSSETIIISDLTDATLRQRFVNPSDIIQVIDSLDYSIEILGEFFEEFQETIQILDALTILRERLIRQSNTIQLLDALDTAVEVLAEFSEVLSEIVSFSDAITILRERLFSVSEVILIGDALETAVEVLGEFTETLSESINIGDAVTVLRQRILTFPETFSFLSSLATAIEYEQILEEIMDTLQPQDALTVIRQRLFTAGETFIINDLMGYAIEVTEYLHELFETFHFTDVIETVFEIIAPSIEVDTATATAWVIALVIALAALVFAVKKRQGEEEE